MIFGSSAIETETETETEAGVGLIDSLLSSEETTALFEAALSLAELFPCINPIIAAESNDEGTRSSQFTFSSAETGFGSEIEGPS
jgi:hypothetical protein